MKPPVEVGSLSHYLQGILCIPSGCVGGCLIPKKRRMLFMSTNRLTASQSFDWHGAQRMCARLVVELPRNLRVPSGCFPKWMVKIMENPIQMDDLGVPLFSETPK